ncbi:MAG: DUF3826 domain-containing protein, partial [Alistipes sp.]|nr:DUF3826 domain-containing protein [Alistipes sp.]
MKRLLTLCALLLTTAAYAQFEARTRSLHETLDLISERFDVKLKCEIDTVGRVVPFADFRIRPYSLEESLQNVVGLFDAKFVKQNDRYYKIKPFEHHRRTPADGEKMLAYLRTKYTDKAAFEARGAQIRKEVRDILEIASLKAQRVALQPLLSKIRKFDGYTVQNFAIQTLPGLYVCGSIYAPTTKGKHPLIVCPNGHFGDGRYRKDQQQRMATLARMGAICADFDLFGWGESEHQVSSVAHRTSYAQQVQLLNGITILDYLLTRPDADPTRVGVNGGSGGGAHSVMLSVVDDRYTALCPVVSLSSHFDGGCPCESGMPIMLAAGGTCGAELAAIFAPKPLCVVSDGKDWTASVPTLEYPYLQEVYRMYDAEEQLSNVHLAAEGHDFGPNKRNAVYAFFGKAFHLDTTAIDETKVTIEPYEALYSFGKQGELMPEDAIRSVNGLAPFFGKQRVRAAAADESVLKKAQSMVAKLNLEDPRAIQIATTAVYNHRRAVRDWHNDHPYTIIPEVEKSTGRKLSKVEREMMADKQIPTKERERLMKDLARVLTPEQIEQILDEYTVGKVAFTMNGYRAIVPNMTAEDEAILLAHLKEARFEAIDCKSMKAISQVFEIYKTKCEQHFNDTGRSWRALFKAYVDKRNAEKKAKKDDEKYIAKSEQIVAALALNNPAKEAAVLEAVKKHRTAVVEWHNTHPYTTIPEVDATTGRKLYDIEREMLADQQIPKSVRKELMKVLKKHLTPEQIIQVWDGYTIGKVAFTMKGYYAIIPDLTAKEAAALEGYLKQAREEALECRRMKGISQVFEVYKTKCEQYLIANGRDWRALFKAYVDKRNAEKAAQKA